MPWRSTFMSRIGSMLPPERTATIGVSKRRGWSVTAATAAAPAGSTTCLARSISMSRAWDSDSSFTVTTSSTSWRTVANGTSPGRPTAMPSAMVVIDESDRDALTEGDRVRRRALGLDPHEGDLGVQRLHRCRDAGQQPAASCRDEDRAHVGTLLEDLHAAGRLPGHDVLVVEGMHE